MSFAAVAIAAVGVGTAVYSAATAPGAPTPPNLAASSQALSDSGAQMLPIERGLANAAQSGSSFTFTPPAGANMQEILSNGGKRNADGSITVDFTGEGTGSTQGQIASQQAADQLKQAQQFDPAFIASAVQQEQLANPQGVRARELENQIIQNQVTNPTQNPVAGTLDTQIGSRVAAGKNLDPFETGVLNNATASALSARGGSGGNQPTDFTAPLTTGMAANQRQLSGIQEGQNWLASGETPEDVAYRKEQQNLSNLSSMVNGATPESQFKSLDNASSGPSPVNSGSPLPTMPETNIGTAGGSALSQYGTALSNQEQQANPWMAGMSTVLNAAGALGQLGYKPLSTPAATTG
jgi:hypothetical protein